MAHFVYSILVDSPVSGHPRGSEKVSVSGVVRLREKLYRKRTPVEYIYEFCLHTGASTGDFQWYKMKLRMS